MTEQTKSVRDLQEKIAAPDKQRERAAVAHLLTLSGHGSKGKAQPSNALEREMLKGAQQ
jgi:hypothetical protein